MITPGESTGHGDGKNRKKKHCNWWCAACGGHYEWRAPNRFFFSSARPVSVQGLEGSEWETMYSTHVEPHKAAKCKKSGENKKAKGALVFERRNRQRNRFFTIGQCAKDSVKNPWAIHLKRPTAALANALARAEQTCGMAQPSAASGV